MFYIHLVYINVCGRLMKNNLKVTNFYTILYCKVPTYYLMLLYYFQPHRQKKWGNMTNMTVVVFVVADGVDEASVVAVDEMDVAIVEHDVGAVVGGDLMRLQKPYHYLLPHHLQWNEHLIRLLYRC